MIYCTLLNPALDIIYSIDTFVSGNTLLDLPLTMVPAGKGINVAAMVRALNEEVCVIGLMPEHDRPRFADFLDGRGIHHHLLSSPGEVRINVTLAERGSGAVSHLNGAGALAPKEVIAGLLKFIEGSRKPGDCWCFSGSLPAGLDDDLYARMIKLCSKEGALTFLDTRGKALRGGSRAKPTAIKPNSVELEELFNEQVQGVHHMALKGKTLLDRGVPYVFISLGSDGMIALHESDCLLCVPPQVRAVDTVGCGDALMAGLLVAWQRRFSFSETCRLAVACGASKAMHAGPHSLVEGEVWQLMEDVRITAI